MSLPSFNFLYIKAGTGKTGTSGEQLEAMWKSNFDMIKSLVMSLDVDVQNRILSNEIQQIKVENGVAYFTTDNGESWVSLGPAFANLAGDPDDNAALVKKFESYVTVASFTNALGRIKELESDVTTMDNTLTQVGADVDTLKEQMNNESTGVLVRLEAVEVSNAHKITSNSVLEIRQTQISHEIVVPDENGEDVTQTEYEYVLEYTTNGQDWLPIASVPGVDWGQIGGQIDNQADLKNRFDILNDTINNFSTNLDNVINKADSLESDLAGANNKLDSLREDLTQLEEDTNTNLDNHINDRDNPHKVDATQIGLGQVDNTSDLDKPLSTVQQAYVDEEIEKLNKSIQADLSTNTSVIALTEDKYSNLNIVDSEKVYMITDIDQ